MGRALYVCAALCLLAGIMADPYGIEGSSCSGEDYSPVSHPDNCEVCRCVSQVVECSSKVCGIPNCGNQPVVYDRKRACCPFCESGSPGGGPVGSPGNNQASAPGTSK